MSSYGIFVACVAAAAGLFFLKRAVAGPQRMLSRIAVLCFPAGVIIEAFFHEQLSLRILATFLLLVGLLAAVVLLAADMWATLRTKK